MNTEKVHTVILGAGPSGLAAGYVLALAGHRPVILDRDKTPGGLMRSIHHKDFVVDVGRKELYNRLPKVDEFWGKVLGDQYRPYPHRGGLLYDGHIIEISPEFKGFRRGMPWGMFIGCVSDFFLARLRSRGVRPKTLAEYHYQKRGRRLTQYISQGFQEKLSGTKWSDIVLPEQVLRSGATDPGFVATLRGAIARTFSAKQDNSSDGRWRHPSRGTGQICDALAKGIEQNGGRFFFGSRITGITATSQGVESVTSEAGGDATRFETKNLITSIPLEFLIPLVFGEKPQPPPEAAPKGSDRRKTVVLVYLFLNGAPHFPQAWLNVTCPGTRIGRISNYEGFCGEMVPKGKGCICCEYYCFGDDELLRKTDQELIEMTLEQCHRYKLIDRAQCFDKLVFRLPGADASQNRSNWMSKARIAMLERLKPLHNVYVVNRSDLDFATLAGIEAAEAILTGDRFTFDEHVDPVKAGIKGSQKTFAFDNPLERANLVKR